MARNGSTNVVLVGILLNESFLKMTKILNVFDFQVPKQECKNVPKEECRQVTILF
jgi:hypothetical protein